MTLSNIARKQKKNIEWCRNRKFSKPKPFTSSILLFLTSLSLFTINYVRVRQFHDEFQITLNPKHSKNPKWFDAIARELGDKKINIGLVNVEEATLFEEVPTNGKTVKVEFKPVDEGLQWSEFFPEWVNESLTTGCPELPMPEFGKYEELDVVVAKVPCNGSGESGWKDVTRLHLNLVVANLLVRSGRTERGRPVYAVFLGCRGPMWEIFTCEDLVLHVGDTWIYKPQLRKIKQKVLMPVGSCQVSPPFAESGEELWRDSDGHIMKKAPREAYATVLHSSEAYVCGAIALAHSLLQTNTTKDLILLADDHISPDSIHALRSSGWMIKRIQRIWTPQSRKGSYKEWNYSKLRLWQLQGYDKVMFIDADFIVMRNLDGFFVYPQISAAPNDKDIFNSGLMLLEPSACTFRTLMRRRWLVKSYNGGDQGFLNQMFPWWHRLPKKVNRIKFFGAGEADHERQVSRNVYALHYVGLKPWSCERDHDCNWDRGDTRQFASDSVNEMWWRVYDEMSAELRRFCELTREMSTRGLRDLYVA